MGEIVPLIRDMHGEKLAVIFLSEHAAHEFVQNTPTLPDNIVKSIVRYGFSGGHAGFLMRLGNMVETYNIDGVIIVGPTGDLLPCTTEHMVQAYHQSTHDMIYAEQLRRSRALRIGNRYLKKSAKVYEEDLIYNIW
jgi:hypothetical protein